MTTIDRSKVDDLIKLADQAVQGMKQVSEGKAPETPTETNAKTFANLADIMAGLVDVAREDQAYHKRLAAALDRVANLKVRSGAELLEQKNWKKLLTEVQSVAQDALAT